jgi:putative transposase
LLEGAPEILIRPVSASDPALMRRIDELHLASPFAGARMLRDLLRRAGHRIGRKRVRTMMGCMGIEALYRKPTSSQRHPAHRVYPYLLRHLEITRSNQVWAADITYLPMTRGFVYLIAVLYWASRQVLAWRLSKMLTTDFCIEAVQIRMDDTGCWRDNVFVERLWRSVKYEEVYLRPYNSVSAARQEVGRYLTF